MPYKWPEKRQLIGKGYTRLDGPQKVTGKAKYSHDRNLPGQLHGKILRSPHAKAKITALDLAPAEQAPGVKAVHIIKPSGTNVNYVGDEIAAVAAETEEQARDALKAIKVSFEVMEPVATEDQALKAAGAPRVDEQGNVDDAMKNAAFSSEGFYSTPVITHLCLETHGLTAWWKSDEELVVYASTQAVGPTANALKQHFKTPPNLKVVCETPFMGGGFGSKFGPDIQGITAAELARKAKRPVKLMLERDEEHWAGGNRPSLFAKVKAGADKDGKLIAFDAETWGTGGNSQGADLRLPYIFAPLTRRIRHRDLNVNAGNKRAFRAPGHPQASVVMDQMMDDLAHAAKIDPVEFRMRNLPTAAVFATLKPIYEKELTLGAEAIGWKKNYHPRGDQTPGPIKRGLGCALSTWGGAAGAAQATCKISPDGSVEVRIGSQDLGTGTVTLVPIVAAEILGLQPGDVQGFIGSSAYPPAGGSGGSTSCGGVSLAVGIASMKALGLLFQKVAAKLGVAADALEAEGGKVYAKDDASKSLSWKQACALLDQQPIEAAASKDGDPAGPGGNPPANPSTGMSSSGVGGAQFADVSVDVETGVVTVNKLVAVADCGMVMNRLLCESQVYGGVVQGISLGLFEERRLDPKSAGMLNADMEWYKLAGHSDLGEIEVHLLDYPERGVIGIGEPPVIPTATALANAVTNAIGVRVGHLPLSPRHVLDALARK
jgi:xanthine dehydrogenase YagR molybdenum-binding subunit